MDLNILIYYNRIKRVGLKMTVLNLKPTINKQRILKKLHIEEGTEAFKSAEMYFGEITKIIMDNMAITATYAETDFFSNVSSELEGLNRCVVCLVTSDDSIAKLSRDIMDKGDYMKGYLLFETASDVFFEASNKLNRIVGNYAENNSFKLTGRLAAGDGKLNLSMQHEILEMIKKEEAVDVTVNEMNVLVPERSLLYLFGLKLKDKDSDNEENECSLCENKDCKYRDEK